MPTVTHEKIDGCDEARVTITFDTSNDAEHAFLKALTDSLTADKRDQYIKAGRKLALIDLTIHSDDANTITLQGIGEDLNVLFHSPPLVVPDNINPPQRFWDVGDAIYNAGIDPYRTYTNINTYAPSHAALAEQIKQVRDDIRFQAELESLINAIRQGRVQVVGEAYFTDSRIFDPHYSATLFEELYRHEGTDGFPTEEFRRLEQKRLGTQGHDASRAH